MIKIQNISEMQPTLGFPVFDILENTAWVFNESELAASFRILFDSIAKAVCHSRLGMQELFQSFCKDSLYGTEGIYRILWQAAGGTF